jgi:uncharacterized surface protein with fasciclin (FAS1) repeats
MHIVDGALPSSSLVNGKREALNGEFLTFSVGQIIEISSPNTDDSIAYVPETLSSEGVFYALGSVLFPSFWTLTIFDILSPTDSESEIGNFSILYELAQLTGLNKTFFEESAPGITLFAPDDNAFNALGEDTLTYYRSNVNVTRTLLLGHVVEKVVSSDEVYDSFIEIPSAAGETLLFVGDEVYSDDDNTYSVIFTVNEVAVNTVDVLAYNGIIHVLDAVLAVPGTEVPSTPSVSPSPVSPPTSEPTPFPSPVDVEIPSPTVPEPTSPAVPVDIETPSPVSDEPPPVENVAPSPVTSLTFRDIIDSDPNFSTLGQTLDTVDIDLGAFDFPVTVFAPNNGAFANLDPTLLSTLLSPGWETHLIIVLASHIVNGAIPSTSLVSGELEALNGEILIVSVGETILLSSDGTNDAVVTLPEILSADGVFYELNDVLLPSFVNVSVSDILASPDLSILNELLILTGLDQLFAPRRMLRANANGTGSTFTVFAPNNDAFTALGADVLDYIRSNLNVTKTLLLGHVILDQVVSTRALDAGPVLLPSAAGDTRTFMSDFTEDGELVNTVDDVEIVIPDVLTIDGIVHVIAGVLDVAGADLPERRSDAPSASPSAVVDCEGKGMMSKKGMEKSKKMEKIGKDSKSGKGKGMDKGISFDSSIGKSQGGDGSGKGKGADISFDKISKGKGSHGSGKGKGSKICGKGKSSKGSSKSGKGKGFDSSGKGKGLDGSFGKGMSSESSTGKKGMSGDSNTSKSKGKKTMDSSSGNGMSSDGTASKGKTSDSSTTKGMGSDNSAGMGMSDNASPGKGTSSDVTGKGMSESSKAGKMEG